MSKEKFETIEDADGIVFYDESDDYVAGERDNDDIFTDEYMQAFSEKMDAQIAREKRNQKIISVGTIVAVLAFIAALTAFFFKDI